MTPSILTEEKPSSILTIFRAKIWMARWNLLLWAVFASVITIACWRLFPGALFWVDGGLRGILLVCSVDFVLGPLLLIVVANPAKSQRERRLDFLVLLSIQILAMAWGGWQIYSQRPVAFSYTPDNVLLPLTMQEFNKQKLSPESLPASRLGDLPAFYVDLPVGQAFLAVRDNRIAVIAQAAFLKPLFSHEAQVLADMGRFESYWAGEGKPAWEAWASRHGGLPPTSYRFITLVGRYGLAILILDQNKQLIGHIQLPDEMLPAVLYRN
ncbi:MAG: hypothetical protein REI12_04510 [Pedobacter sp.]|nr:hypothetical protein [Pedobacter sp.]